MKKKLCFCSKPKCKLICILGALVITSLVSETYAQESIVTSGSSVTSENGSISYSVGQVADRSSADENGSIEQGVQHSIVITTVNELEEAKDIELSYSVFPNPVTSILKIKSSTANSTDLFSYELYDLAGNQLRSGNFNLNEVSIDISNLSASTYILYVKKESKEIKSFKIIKN